MLIVGEGLLTSHFSINLEDLPPPKKWVKDLLLRSI